MGHPGGVQEASWEVLGLSGEVRGASWEGLGRSWGDLGATFRAAQFRIDFLIDFGRQKGAQREAFWEPKWYQNRTKIEVESEDEKKTLLKASWIDFGTFCKPRGKAKTMKFYWFC